MGTPLGRVQIECCYALSAVADLIARGAPDDLLADRERECLAWVAEGKTTGEVAQILFGDDAKRRLDDYLAFRRRTPRDEPAAG